ncbi:MAG: YihY/virulence factor BrkB family protein [Actinomycetota bacterium]|nr:YihY/virulence factor BrkB family protein [Actinomycetota bacterium]
MASTAQAQHAGRPAEGPSDLPPRSWWSALVRAAKAVPKHELPHWAAALTYYGVLSLFPALLALVAILGVVGSSAIQPLITNLAAAAPGPGKEIAVSTLQGLQRDQGAAGVVFFVGLGAAIWSASSYVSGFMSASNAIYDVREGRPFWKKIPVRIATTIAMLLGLAVSALAVVLTGSLAEQLGRLVGIGDTAVSVWGIAKWPVLVLLVAVMFDILYWAAPNVRQPGFRWVTPGGALAVVLWIAASAAFAVYVANFASYNKTYGSLGGVVVFLVWLWISNLAILVGAELNAELARGRQMQAGQPPDERPILPPRDPPES